MKAVAFSAVAAMLLPVGFSPADAAPYVQVAGSAILLVIDADGDGPEPDEDCTIRATFDGYNLAFTKTQTNTPLIKGCNGGTTSGSMVTGQDASSDYIVTEVTSTSTPSGATPPRPPLAGLFVIPFRLDAYEEFPNDHPDGFPAALNTVEFETGSGTVLATGYLCAAGGPAVLIDFGVASVRLPLDLYPSAAAPTHLRIPHVPYELGAPNLGSFALVDLYVALQDRAIRLGIEGESPLLVDIPLDELAPCRSKSTAPALSTWALALTAAALFAVGIRRRRRVRARRGTSG